MKYLILGSLLLVLQACNSSYIGKFNLVEKRMLSDYEISAITSNNYDNIKFKAYVEAYGHNITGIFIVKKTVENTYKIGFINNTGIVLFSLEISKDKVQLFNCLEQLNNTTAIKIIENDLRTILFPNIPEGKVKILSEKNAGEMTLCFINGENGLIYYIVNSKHALSKIDIIGKDELITSILFQKNPADSLKYIDVKHYDYPLEIILEEFSDEQ
jgi:hypothetical protein